MDSRFWIKIILNAFELTALVAGVINWGKVKHTYWKYFVFYCGVILMTELLAKYIGYGLRKPGLNADIYFFFGIPVQFFFFFWLFYRWSSLWTGKIFALLGLLVYLIAWVLEWLYLREKKMWFSSFSYLMGNIFLLILLVNYFIRFVTSNEILQYRSDMMFWVAAGILVFFVGTLPFYGLRNFLYYNYRGIFYFYWDASYFLDCLMYLFFTFSFVWGKPK